MGTEKNKLAVNKGGEVDVPARSGAQVQRDQHTQDSPFYRVDGPGARRAT